MGRVYGAVSGEHPHFLMLTAAPRYGFVLAQGREVLTTHTTQARHMDRRLMLEDICSDVARYLHADGRPDEFGSVVIDREWNLGLPGAFADIRVEPADAAPYFIEIKTGYTPDEIVRHLNVKYGQPGPRLDDASRVVVIVESRDAADRRALEAAIRGAVSSAIDVEVWDGEQLGAHTERLFGVSIRDVADEDALLHLRRRINVAKSRLAFGGNGADADEILRQSLLWHFGVWRLRELRRSSQSGPRDEQLVAPGHYERAIVVMADLTSFTSFVRDTPDEDVVRASLTAFYAKARYQVINAGGMLYQFVGDEVSAIFGIPDQRPGYVKSAVRTARGLREIARAVTMNWQRRIDRVQPFCGAHIGIAMGDLDLVAQRPFDGAHIGAFGNTLNLAARLLQTAGPDEIVISNVLRQELGDGQYTYDERPGLELKNFGTVRSWQLRLPSLDGARK